MSTHPMNVLVYSGSGSGAYSVRHCLYTLRRLLSPAYAVIPVSGEQIIKEPWQKSCAALVFPGGADQGYCRTLNGSGNRRIRRFVEDGGVYIGFCAGGYYGSQKCEFEVGNAPLEVIGRRELAFFPGIARGGAFSGFVYSSEEGARAAELRIHDTQFSHDLAVSGFRSYYNGGAVFVDAERYRNQGVEVLASYTEEVAVEPGKGSAAVVQCKVGQGCALLTGPHPEFAAVNLHKEEGCPGFDKVIETLMKNEQGRVEFMKFCLKQVGLGETDEQGVPTLSRLHLSSLQPKSVTDIYRSLSHVISVQDEQEYINDDDDTFRIIKLNAYDFGRIREALSASPQATNHFVNVASGNEAGIVNHNTIIKVLLFHERAFPPLEHTPYFDHRLYYSHLEHCQKTTPDTRFSFGHHLLYGEVVTSTNSLLEKNTQLLRCLPTGFTAVATTQLAGRGRGSNVWVSPPGSLMFSTVIHHPMALMPTAPVVFVQYLAALAVVESVKSYDNGRFKNIPLKLKWPNDIYALNPAGANQKVSHGKTINPKSSLLDQDQDREEYVKIGGILVNSHYDMKNYIAVCGIGLNLSNNLPTISLNALASHHLSTNQDQSSPVEADGPFNTESLLPAILTTFDALYTRFLHTGFDADFQQRYYANWLHDNQIITLEAEVAASSRGEDYNSGGDNANRTTHARIKGITPDFGLLLVEEVIMAPTTTMTTTAMREGVEERPGSIAHNVHDGGSGTETVATRTAGNTDGNISSDVTGTGTSTGIGADESYHSSTNSGKQWKSTGQLWKLQSDSNSFDFFRGLIKRKL